MDAHTVTRANQRTLTVNKTTTREVVFKLCQFRETLEKSASEEGSDLFNFYLGAGYVLMDICEILGLSAVETKVVMGEATAKQQETCYSDQTIEDIPLKRPTLS